MKHYILAHATEVAHEENTSAADVASVEPIYLGGVFAVVLIIGFLIWKFLLKKHG